MIKSARQAQPVAAEATPVTTSRKKNNLSTWPINEPLQSESNYLFREYLFVNCWRRCQQCDPYRNLYPNRRGNIDLV